MNRFAPATLFAALALAACGGPPSTIVDEDESEALANFTPPLPPGEEIDHEVEKTTPDGAVAVIEAYFEAVRSGRANEAYRMWGHDGADMGMGVEAFADKVDALGEFEIVVGDPGREEGAAGSVYLEVPVKFSAATEEGIPADTDVVFTMKRVNDVPGASEDQRHWRIVKGWLPAATE